MDETKPAPAPATAAPAPQPGPAPGTPQPKPAPAAPKPDPTLVEIVEYQDNKGKSQRTKARLTSNGTATLEDGRKLPYGPGQAGCWGYPKRD